ncbi:MAG: 4Fe-4S binding protein [Candidatus Wallbacteria bacterium]|nr:4Fe-4S binding protein [Candidatus Wallbacteria bacterium]
MGHVVNHEREYRLLQQRLDRMVTGAPESPELMKILQMLFSSEEAELACRIPSQPASLEVLSREVGMPRAELDEKLTGMARRGLMLDLELEGERYFALPPVVIGFFEFVFMRARPDMPLAELAQLFEKYMHGDGAFAHSVFAGQTQLGRALVREEALPEGDHTEILDWERASRIVQDASSVGVSTCPCRHKKEHLGKVCDAPQRTCLTFGYAADSMVRTGAAERIDTSEAMHILEQCKESGLVQIGDNVQRRLSFMCNCCKCCCGMLDAVTTFNIHTAIVTSNWIVSVDPERCRGCGKCVKACPVGALELCIETVDGRRRGRSVPDEELCLGCGVCSAVCKDGGISMRPRKQRVYCPEDLFEKAVAMAIERGKLAELLFEERERLSHRALARLVKVLEKSGPMKAAMAIHPLRSAFLWAMAKGARMATGKLRRLFEAPPA